MRGAALVGAVLSVACAHKVKLEGGTAVALPAGWVASAQAASAHGVTLLRPGAGGALAASATVTVERRADHAAALRRLGEVAAEQREPGVFTAVAGWPALQRRLVRPAAKPLGEVPEGAQLPTGPTLRTTTAIAAGALLVRVEGGVAPGQPASLADEIDGLARGLSLAGSADAAQTARELEALRAVRPERHPAPSRRGRPPPPQPQSATSFVLQDASELAITASDNGRHVVIYSNAGGVYSHNSGATWQSVAFVLSGTVYKSGGGDPSLGWGASGAFYASGMRASAPHQSSVAVWVSTNDGASFGFGSYTQTCDPLGTPDFCIADYPHMAVDRHNQAGGKDQVYVVSRRLNGWAKPAISCSADGAKTFPTMVLLSAGLGADHGRPIVGRDGSVYVVYMAGNSVLLDRFSSCERGLTLEATSVIAADGSVACPVPGQELCDADDVALMTSPMVAADDADPAHVYVAYAVTTAAGNEDVLVADSLDRGETWTGLARANAQVPARRFMPWVCATSGAAQVTWYDRRAATPDNNDLTSYYRATVAGKGGALAGVDEQDLAGANDPQCRSGWPCHAYSIDAAESCSVQPQRAGVCQDATGKNGGSCDFSDNDCPAGQTCTLVIPTCRRYGDYTGNGCAAGRLFAAWSSAVPPAGVSAPAGIQLYARTVQVGPICGERDLPCCAGNACDDHLVCIERSVSLPTPHLATTCECGGAAQPCCLSAPQCESGLGCNARGKCVSTAPPPPCGGKGERCCARGAACAQGLTCFESRCIEPADPCAVCTQRELACLTACTGDGACECRCRNVACECQQQACGSRCLLRQCPIPG